MTNGSQIDQKPKIFREYKVQSIDLIKNYEHNSRTHSEEQIQEVVNSINEFGYTNPILVDENNVIIAGHCRIAGAKRAGMTEIPTIIIDGLTDVQKAALVIADNKLALNAGWDFTKLSEQITFLCEKDYDTAFTGFKADEIASFMPDTVPEFLGDEDDVPDAPVEPITKLGDVWILGNHRLLCGDSTMIDDVEKLMNGEKADMVFTDPPYGLDYSGGRTQVVKNKPYGKLENDDLAGDDLGNLICNIFTLNAKEIYICVSPKIQKPFLDFIQASNKEVDAIIVWDKGTPGLGYMKYRRQCEFIIYVRDIDFNKTDKSDFDLWSIPKDASKDYVHSTQKPVAIPERAITNSSQKSQIVVDLFGGSGSTLIACEKTARKCYMMELSQQYCDVIIARWEKLTGKKAELEASNGTGS